MQRRRPARLRQGEASFGRRIPHCNFALIKAEVEAMKNISVINFDDSIIKLSEDSKTKGTGELKFFELPPGN